MCERESYDPTICSTPTWPGGVFILASIATPHAGKFRVYSVAHRRLERLIALIQDRAEVVSNRRSPIKTLLYNSLEVWEWKKIHHRARPRYKSRRGQVEGSPLQDIKAFQQAVKQKSRREGPKTFFHLNGREPRIGVCFGRHKVRANGPLSIDSFPQSSDLNEVEPISNQSQITRDVGRAEAGYRLPGPATPATEKGST